jgi:hypothetical protein
MAKLKKKNGKRTNDNQSGEKERRGEERGPQIPYEESGRDTYVHASLRG